MKQLLAILGSPWKNGLTAQMLQCAVSAAEAAGWQVQTVNLYEQDLGFCAGCLRCDQTGACVRQDGIQAIAAALQSCDAVAPAAPTYWANVPAPVKNLFDRLRGTAMENTATFPRPRLSHRQSYLLLTACTTPFPFDRLCGQSSGALRAMNEFFRTAGMRPLGKVVCAGTKGRTCLPPHVEARIRRCWRKI